MGDIKVAKFPILPSVKAKGILNIIYNYIKIIIQIQFLKLVEYY